MYRIAAAGAGCVYEISVPGILSAPDVAAGTPIRTPGESGSPFRLRHAPPRIQYPGLPMGGANDYVLQGLLGYPAGEVARMKEEKVI